MNDLVRIISFLPEPAKYFPLFAVDKDDAIIGEVYVYIIGSERQRRHYAYIDDLNVSNTHQGLGIGRALMERAHAIAQKECCYKVIANSHAKRVAARALYASLGYYPHGTEFRLDLTTLCQMAHQTQGASYRAFFMHSFSPIL